MLIQLRSKRTKTRCSNATAMYCMGRANAICDTRIGYARYANTLCAARIRYAMHECDMRYANRLRAMSNCKVAFLATIYMASPRRCAGHDSVHPDCWLDIVQHIDTLIPYWHIFSGNCWNFDYDFQASWGISLGPCFSCHYPCKMHRCICWCVQHWCYGWYQCLHHLLTQRQFIIIDKETRIMQILVWISCMVLL